MVDICVKLCYNIFLLWRKMYYFIVEQISDSIMKIIPESDSHLLQSGGLRLIERVFIPL